MKRIFYFCSRTKQIGLQSCVSLSYLCFVMLVYFQILISCKSDPEYRSGVVYQGDTLYAPLVLAEQFYWKKLYKDTVPVPDNDTELVVLKYHYYSQHDDSMLMEMYVYSDFVSNNHRDLPDSLLGTGFHTLRPEDLVEPLMDRYLVRPGVLLYFKPL